MFQVKKVGNSNFSEIKVNKFASYLQGINIKCSVKNDGLYFLLIPEAVNKNNQNLKITKLDY